MALVASQRGCACRPYQSSLDPLILPDIHALLLPSIHPLLLPVVPRRVSCGGDTRTTTDTRTRRAAADVPTTWSARSTRRRRRCCGGTAAAGTHPPTRCILTPACSRATLSATSRSMLSDVQYVACRGVSYLRGEVGVTGGGGLRPKLTEHDGPRSVVGCLQHVHRHARRAMRQMAGSQPRSAAEALSAAKAMAVAQLLSDTWLKICFIKS
jgi:hypothetical protein